MSAKQGNCRNKVNIKHITIYSLLVAVCLIIGYLESILSISLIAIAPGVKIGLSNAIALTLICYAHMPVGVAFWLAHIFFAVTVRWCGIDAGCLFFEQKQGGE